jgi:polynucleotide 5'-kinase involved in rRNA processing
MCHSSLIFVLFVIIGRFLVETQSSPSSPRPVQLVAPDSSHQNLVLLEENIHYLENIQEITAILSVVGPFHSGKSYLLNSLLGVSQNGFQLGE